MPHISESKKEATVSKRGRGAKNSETAAKVALMKLKMHAFGDKSLPQVSHAHLFPNIITSCNALP